VPQKIEKVVSGASMSTNDLSNNTGSPPTTIAQGPGQFENRTRILQGLTPADALIRYESELTPYETSELSRFQYIYTVGSVRVHSRNQVCSKDGSYVVTTGE
jgi:hypothetical protein